jgi:hypothetical protein
MRFDLYGFNKGDIQTLAAELGAHLNVSFAPHDSSYRGGEYFRASGRNKEDFILQQNFDALKNAADDAYAEPSFKEYKIMLYVSESDRADEIKRILLSRYDGAAFLRSRII